MARADLLVALVEAEARGDHPLFRRAVEALAAEERAKNHRVLADRLTELLTRNGHRRPDIAPRTPSERVENLVIEAEPRRSLDDLILSPPVRTVLDELIEEHHRADLLRSYGIEPRHRVLLAGPPGNGKTSVAEAIAYGLMVPLIAIRYEQVVGSFLGETASRLQRVFDAVRARRCVLFFDEFDVLGKERGDEHDTGEIKRVVSSLLLQIDDIPSYVVIVVASNHPELLDRAVWRRFPVRLALENPTKTQRTEWFTRFMKRSRLGLGMTAERLAEATDGACFADVEDLGLDIQRRYVLGLPNPDMANITRDRLAQWRSRFTLASRASPAAKDD